MPSTLRNRALNVAPEGSASDSGASSRPIASLWSSSERESLDRSGRVASESSSSGVGVPHLKQYWSSYLTGRLQTAQRLDGSVMPRNLGAVGPAPWLVLTSNAGM